MSPLRDFLIAPRATDVTARPPVRTARLPWRRPASQTPAATYGPSVGVLAVPRDLHAVAAAAGLALVRAGSAAVVCLRSPDAASPDALTAPATSTAPLSAACAPAASAPPAPAASARAAPGPRAPAHAAAARLAASLRARGLAAEARGRLALVALPHDPAECASGAAHALAAAGPAPTVLAVAGRDEDVDVLLAARDAVLVALPPSTDPTLASLALASAQELARSAAAVHLALDPIARALALAGVRTPRSMRDAIDGVIG
jgi:hypothetical protein